MYLLPPPPPLLLLSPPIPQQQQLPPSAGAPTGGEEILIVEDDEIIAEMLITVLEEGRASYYGGEEGGEGRGLTGVITPSVQGARTFLTARKQTRGGILPRMILLDFLLLGSETGGDLLLWMQDDPLFAAIPVILLPASRPYERAGIAQAVSLATQVVYKPFEVADFLAACTEACPSLFVHAPVS